MLNRIGLPAVGEDVRDQGDALICGEGKINQVFPRWDAATREKSTGQ